MKEFRILHFVTPFYPRKSGLGNYIIGLSENLPNNYKIDVVCCDTEDTKIFKDKYKNIEIFRIKSWALFHRSYFIPKIFPMIKTFRILNNREYSLIHTHTRFFITSLFGWILAKIKCVPLIHVEHGSSFVQNTNKVISFSSKLYDFTLGKFILNRADAIFCVSKHVEKFVLSISKNNNLYLLYNGVDTSYFRKINGIRKIKYKFNIPYNGFVVTFIGRLTESKGVQDLIKAVADLNQNILLVVAGDGPYSAELKKLSNALHNKNFKIIFLGEINREQVVELLSITDIFVNPSYTEGMPTSLLEAGSVGCACIATDVGGTSEIINPGENSFLFPKSDTHKLMENLRILIKNKEMRVSFGNKLNNIVTKNFDWNIISKKYIEMIQPWLIH